MTLVRPHWERLFLWAANGGHLRETPSAQTSPAADRAQISLRSAVVSAL